MFISSSDVFILLIKEIGKRPKLRKGMLLISSIISVALIIALVIINIFFPYLLFEGILKNVLLISIGISIFIFFIAITSYFSDEFEQVSIRKKLSTLEDERIEIENSIKKGNNGNVQEIIRLNLNQLDEYYTINKEQNKKSYTFAAFMITVGFVCLVAAIIMFFANPDQYLIAIISGVAGILAEYIGATSLVLYKESTGHINEFIERLTYLQKVMLAIDLTEKLPDAKRDEQISSIISGLIMAKGQDTGK